jgi:hypothetical protein
MSFLGTQRKEVDMILSPCRSCARIALSKEDCAKTCPLIASLQKMAATANAERIDSIDYADDARFSLSKQPSMGT